MATQKELIIINTEHFEVLRSLSNECFTNACYGGLRTLLASDPNFSKYSEKNYRIEKYRTTHNFYLTHHESDIHLIGFMDALIYLCRAGYLNLDPQEQETELFEEDELDEDELALLLQLEEKDEKIRQAINACIVYVETGESL